MVDPRAHMGSSPFTSGEIKWKRADELPQPRYVRVLLYRHLLVNVGIYLHAISNSVYSEHLHSMSHAYRLPYGIEPLSILVTPNTHRLRLACAAYSITSMVIGYHYYPTLRA